MAVVVESSHEENQGLTIPKSPETEIDDAVSSEPQIIDWDEHQQVDVPRHRPRRRPTRRRCVA
jgi:hypothetical protein